MMKFVLLVAALVIAPSMQTVQISFKPNLQNEISSDDVEPQVAIGHRPIFTNEAGEDVQLEVGHRPIFTNEAGEDVHVEVGHRPIFTNEAGEDVHVGIGHRPIFTNEAGEDVHLEIGHKPIFTNEPGETELDACSVCFEQMKTLVDALEDVFA